MLTIKLQRIGKKHQPSYRLVVAEKRSKLGGPAVEDLGSYNPFAKKAGLNKERLEYWLKVGARPTATAHNLLVKEGIVQGPKIRIKFRVKGETETKSAAPESPVAKTAETKNINGTV